MIAAWIAGVLAASPLARAEQEGASLAPFVWSVDDGALTFEVPRGEKLVFDVQVDIGVLGDPEIGTMTIETGVDPYEPGVLVGETDGAGAEVGWIRAVATGESVFYSVEEVLTTSYLPQTWPRVLHRKVQTGSENRRAEQKIGLHDDKRTVWSRRDRHCKECDDRTHWLKPKFTWSDEKHCQRCKKAEHRVWGEPETRGIDARAVDMLSAVLIAREMVSSGARRRDFQVLDRIKPWDVRMRTGGRKIVELPLGKYDAVLLRLETKVPENEPPREDAKFKGLFGLKGSIEIWLEANSGVPVWITGTVPAGPIDVGIEARLREVVGAPASFAPAK